MNLLTQGMVCKETYFCKVDGWLFPEEVENGKCVKCGGDVEIGRVEKMSKSKKNVIDPENIIKKYGADTARLFILFASPPDKTLEWSEQGVEGCYRFLKRVWNLVVNNIDNLKSVDAYTKDKGNITGKIKNLRRKTHETIKKVNSDIENRFHFNTAISAIMELVNEAYTAEIKSEIDRAVFRETVETVVQLLSPFVPHFADELWYMLTGKENDFLLNKSFPEFEEDALKKDNKLIVVQINGKVRDKLTVNIDAEEDEIKGLALKSHKIEKALTNKTVKKIIYVKNRLLNIVVS